MSTLRWQINFVIVLLLTGMAFAELPEAPLPQAAPVSHCGPHWMGGCWDYTHPTLAPGKTFQSLHFWAPIGLADAAYVADAWTSEQAIRRGCTEGNADLPSRPNAGDYAKNWAKFELPLDAFAWMIVKLNRPVTNHIVEAMAATRIAVHMRGVHTALGCH
jgi:hypothetical protein